MARAILKRRNICTCKGHGYAGNYTTGTSGVATCVTPAKSYKICQFCKTTFDEQEIPATGQHSNTTTYVYCTKAGAVVCNDCGATLETIEPQGHNAGSGASYQVSADDSYCYIACLNSFCDTGNIIDRHTHTVGVECTYCGTTL